MSKDLNSTEIEKLKQEISTILKQEIPETKELKQEIYTDFKEWNDVSVSFERWREHSCELQAQLRELKQETTENSEGVSKEISTSCDASSEDKLLVDNCEKKKKEKVFVTMRQRECIINFMIENPELITHSSTADSELKLWKELASQLNALKPEKDLKCWKDYWRRWLRTCRVKTEGRLTQEDCKLTKYLNQITPNDGASGKKTKRKITVQEINDQLNKIEEKKMQINFELDELNYAVLKYKNLIEDSEKKISELNNIKAKLTIAKRYLHYRKRMIQEENNNSYNTEHCIIKKEKSLSPMND